MSLSLIREREWMVNILIKRLKEIVNNLIRSVNNLIRRPQSWLIFILDDLTE